MKIEQGKKGTLSPGEYQLMMEELNRECTPSTFGFGKSIDGKNDIPVLILKVPLEHKNKFIDADIMSVWGMLRSDQNIDAIYLDMEVKDTASFRVCFDKTMFGDLLFEWFKLLIKTDGFLMLSDTMELGMVESIGVPNIPLDIPKLIINQIQRTKIRA